MVRSHKQEPCLARTPALSGSHQLWNHPLAPQGDEPVSRDAYIDNPALCRRYDERHQASYAAMSCSSPDRS